MIGLPAWIILHVMDSSRTYLAPSGFLIYLAQSEELSEVDRTSGKMKYMIDRGDLEPVSGNKVLVLI